MVAFFAIDLQYLFAFCFMLSQKNIKYLSSFNCAELVPLAPYMQQLERCAPSYKNIKVCHLEIQFFRIIQDNETQPA